MHEGAISRSLLNLAAQTSRESGLSEVTRVRVIIGKFHCVINEVLETNFDLQKQDIPCFENAVLEIEERDVKIQCKNCQKTIDLNEVSFTCPYCGSPETDIIQGNELHLDFIEGKKDI
jgi:hydrogenase nickel incorporation protein HypA/HybF